MNLEENETSYMYLGAAVAIVFLLLISMICLCRCAKSKSNQVGLVEEDAQFDSAQHFQTGEHENKQNDTSVELDSVDDN